MTKSFARDIDEVLGLLLQNSINLHRSTITWWGGHLLQTQWRGLSLWLFVGHDREPRKNGWTDPHAFYDVDCIRSMS